MPQPKWLMSIKNHDWLMLLIYLIHHDSLKRTCFYTWLPIIGKFKNDVLELRLSKRNMEHLFINMFDSRYSSISLVQLFYTSFKKLVLKLVRTDLITPDKELISIDKWICQINKPSMIRACRNQSWVSSLSDPWFDRAICNHHDSHNYVREYAYHCNTHHPLLSLFTVMFRLRLS